jgi:hypothetical protein
MTHARKSATDMAALVKMAGHVDKNATHWEGGR